MQKSEDAVTHMQPILNSLKFIIGSSEDIEKMRDVAPLPIFSDEAVSFLDALSGRLLKTSREYPDVATFAFWCRKSSLLKEKGKYADAGLRQGRGVAFHSTPSNVPVNFAFSFAAGLLAGNANIVRLPAKDFAQVVLICDAMNDLFRGEFKHMAPYFCMVKYPPSKEITDYFSAICDTRLIWGGDMTIAEMRRSELNPRAKEITFADRFSIAVIDADKYLQSKDQARITQNFYNDTYYSDQNACTAPRLVVWLGKEKERAKASFWRSIHEKVVKEYKLAPIQAVGKLNALYKAVSLHELKLVPAMDNYVTRIEVDLLEPNIMKFKYNSGFFFEYDAEQLEDILPICVSQCQTLTYFGLEKIDIRRFLMKNRPRGIDRVVPLGASMDFTLIWDGYDLISELSKVYSVILR